MWQITTDWRFPVTAKRSSCYFTFTGHWFIKMRTRTMNPFQEAHIYMIYQSYFYTVYS